MVMEELTDIGQGDSTALAGFKLGRSLGGSFNPLDVVGQLDIFRFGRHGQLIPWSRVILVGGLGTRRGRKDI